jgi:sugar phosphate isomerase/epimerase
LFDGLYEYARFVDKHPDLGVLIDISHNYYDKFSEDDVINILGNKNIKGFHLSDALQDVDFRKGTHLAIGDGTIDFSKLLNYFKKFPDLYCALELRASNEGVNQSIKNLKNIIID